MARQLEPFPNLVSMFLTRAREQGDAPFLWAKRGGSWQSISYAQAARQVAALADSLRRIGLAPGDRVMLVSENRPEWLNQTSRSWPRAALRVPTYTTNTTRDHAHILGNSGAKAAIVSSQTLARALIPAVLFSSECRTSSHRRHPHQPGDRGARFYHGSELAAGDGVSPRSRPRCGGRPRRPCLPDYTSGNRRRGARRAPAPTRDPPQRRAASDVISSDFGWM